jgi:hypothetical protein
MTVGVAPTTRFYDQPYLTVQEYKDAPTAIDFDNLVVGGNANAQNAELANVILRASSFMDEYLNQNLNASVQTETQRIRMTPEGYIALHPFNDPVVALESFYYGSTPNNLTALGDCSLAWFEEQQIIIPITQMLSSFSSQGPLEFGGYGGGRNQIFVKYTYVAGYVNNLITTATATQSSMIVQSASGITAGMSLRIIDGANSESVTVASNYVYGSTTVPLVSALLYTHASGIPFGNMPSAIKQACVLITTAFIKARGDGSMMMQVTTNASRNSNGGNIYGNDLNLALQMLDLFRRIR